MKRWEKIIFQKLKKRNERVSVFVDRKNPSSFTKSPDAKSSVFKANEKSRLVRCRHCGWICDKERDVLLKDGSFAGFGINQGVQLQAGTSIGDRVVPAAGAVASTVDQYFDRTQNAGCPCCSSYLYDPAIQIEPFPIESKIDPFRNDGGTPTISIKR